MGLLLLGEGTAFELGLAGGAGRLLGDNISESQTGFVAVLSASHTLVDGVDYIFDLQYAQVGVKTDLTYVYRSVGIGIRWYPSSDLLYPYCTGHIGFFDWRIERGGKTAVSTSTYEEMHTRSLGLGMGVGCMLQLSQRISADVLLLSHFIFSQNPSKFGPDDENEVLLQAQMGLSYRLF